MTIVDYWSKTFSMLVQKDFSRFISFLKEMMKPYEVPQLVNCDRCSLLCNVSNVLSSSFIFTADGKITQHRDDGENNPKPKPYTAFSSASKVQFISSFNYIVEAPWSRNSVSQFTETGY